MKESSDPLSPASMLLPVSLNHSILSLEEDYRQCKINPGEKSLPKDFNKLSWSMHEKNHQETSAFRFSISRLPKWAQSKITSTESVVGDALAISSEVFHIIVVQLEGANYAEFLQRKKRNRKRKIYAAPF